MTTTTATTGTTTNTISALGAGSGVDVKTLAQNLVNAERTPAKTIIDGKISKSQGSISGIASVNFVLAALKTAFTDLQNQSAFNSNAPTNSQPGAFSVATGTTTTPGTHSITVTQLATAQRSMSPGIPTGFQFNGDAAFSLSLTVGTSAPQTIAIAAGATRAADVVAAINQSNSGVTAQMVNTGDADNPYRIVVTGSTGAQNGFSLAAFTNDADGAPTTTPVDGLSFGATTVAQAAGNATLVVDGVAVTSSSNRVDGAIQGTVLDLTSTTSGTATLQFTRDTLGIKTKLQALVSAYNDVNTQLNVVSDPKSSVPTYGATLVGDSLINTVRSQIRSMVFGNSNAPSGGLTALRDLGISVNNTGVLSLDTTELDTVLSTKFDNVVTLLTNNQEKLGSYSTAAAGLAGESARTLTKLLATSGSLAAQTTNQTARIAAYNKDLVKLEDRMTQLLARYTKQFAAMDALVGQTNSLRTSLTSSFEGMMAAYTNK